MSKMKIAVILAAAYAAACFLLLTGAYDPVAVVNAVLAERGGFAVFELAHPAYSPLLFVLSKILSAAGLALPHMGAFQAVSVLFSAASVGLAFLILSGAGLSRLAAAAGAVCFGFSGGAWYWAMQAKPYAPAVFFSLVSLYLLAGPGKPGRARLLLSAAACALATSFTLACAALLPALWWRLSGGRGKEGAAQAALFTGAWAACLLALYVPLLAWKWSRISVVLSGNGLAAIGAVPGGGTLLASGSLARQLALYWERSLSANYALAAALLFAAAGLARQGLKKKGTDIFMAALAGALSFFVFFLLADPHNDFVFFVTALAALAGAGLGARIRLLRLALPVLAALSVFFAVRPALPKAAGPGDLYRGEAEFLAARLAPGDTLLCAGPPDLRLAYLLTGKVTLLQMDMGGNEGNYFTPELLPPGDELRKKLAEAFASGRRVLLGSDMIFRPDSLWTEAETNARVNGAVGWLARGYTVGFGAPEISPNGQYYYPISPKSRKR